MDPLFNKVIDIIILQERLQNKMATIDKSLAILGLSDEGTSIGEAVKAYR